MKKATILLLCILCFQNIQAQTPAGDYLDINNIKARFNADGSLFWDFNVGQFRVPKSSNTTGTIFAGGIWIGGYDNGNVLKLAGQTYRQTGNDFWPGPLDTAATTDSTTVHAYNKLWKIDKCTIDSFKVHCQTGLPVNYVRPNIIDTWPTHNPWGQPLAPFFDYNNDGVYSPDSCEYPLIKGDQAIFYVYNDAADVHTETGGGIIGIEIQAMAYAYNCINDSALYNTIFTNYKIINKSALPLDSVFLGNWMDVDIGAYNDDYIGCDVGRSAYYAYNGDLVDGPSGNGEYTYGANPPAQAIVFLRGPLKDADGMDNAANTTPNGYGYGDVTVDNERLGMTNFVYYNNDQNPVNGNPSGADDFYQYMTSTWRNGQPVTYGGNGTAAGTAAKYMFPGTTDPMGFGTNMSPQAAWDETTVGNFPTDKRGLGATGPFTLQAGATQEIDFAYVYGRATSGGNLASVTVMQNRIDSVKQKFNAGIATCGCATSPNGISTLTNANTFSFYPNPASTELSINYTGNSKTYSIKVYDALGQLVKFVPNVSMNTSTLNIGDLNNGMYLLTIYDRENTVTKRFVKQ